MERSRLKWLGVVAALAGAAGAAAQEASPEPARTVGPRPRLPSEPIKPTGAAPETKPATGTIPGLEDASFLVGVAGLRSEGTFLVEKRGSMIKLPTGERVFVFHAPAEGKRERPMVLLACQRLQQMEQIGGEEPAVFVLTGQVFVYSGVNYLLPTLVRQVGQAAPTQGAGEPVEGTPTEGDPGVKELIRQLEAQRELPRGPEVKPMEARSESGEGQPLAEGLAVSRRRGRLVRLAGGEWALAFDSGTSGDAKVDRPMTLSPCLNLQRMEAWAMRSGDAASFEVSGRVLAYQGRNYLIPTMFQVSAPSELEPRH